MNPDEKRQLENELVVMGLPGLDDPNLLQAMADVVNGYPFMAERVEFFCDLLNECEGARRQEMYDAMRPRLAFEVPSLFACEAAIAAKAERMIRPQGMPGDSKAPVDVEYAVDLECGGCCEKAQFTAESRAAAMLKARHAGWGRGPKQGREYCASCRLVTMPMKVFGDSFTSRFGAGGVN